jgi:hypothetical protein
VALVAGGDWLWWWRSSAVGREERKKEIDERER